MLIGAELRRLREARGINAWDAAHVIRASQSKISRMELGRIGFKERDVADLLTLYGVTDETERETLLAMTRQASAPGWWHRYSDVIPPWLQTYVGLEEAVSVVRGFAAGYIPDLLQTREYASTVGKLGRERISQSDLELQVDFKMRRQQLLRAPDPPRLWFVIDEAVLRRPIANVETMRAQLEHLIEVGHLSNVSIQILPFGAPRRANGSFSILRFAQPSLPDVVHLELLNQALYLEKWADVDIYRQEFNELAAVAVAPAEIRHFILEAIAELSRTPRDG
ncbi:helix-turn-helix domain-containing protein [Acrocarpospora catenulata]|uniref:helix-turn-helix domain-containing protein n=1 Tax=Acrocarpospora catenulata TaxID=2836182 RepID=UPI002023B28A|nr:helix-turn-helix transcriptional regulator [Acrocarpospora catenulata]